MYRLEWKRDKQFSRGRKGKQEDVRSPPKIYRGNSSYIVIVSVWEGSLNSQPGPKRETSFVGDDLVDWFPLPLYSTLSFYSSFSSALLAVSQRSVELTQSMSREKSVCVCAGKCRSRSRSRGATSLLDVPVQHQPMGSLSIQLQLLPISSLHIYICRDGGYLSRLVLHRIKGHIPMAFFLYFLNSIANRQWRVHHYSPIKSDFLFFFFLIKTCTRNLIQMDNTQKNGGRLTWFMMAGDKSRCYSSDSSTQNWFEIAVLLFFNVDESKEEPSWDCCTQTQHRRIDTQHTHTKTRNGRKDTQSTTTTEAGQQ